MCMTSHMQCSHISLMWGGDGYLNRRLSVQIAIAAMREVLCNFTSAGTSNPSVFSPLWATTFVKEFTSYW